MTAHMTAGKKSKKKVKKGLGDGTKPRQLRRDHQEVVDAAEVLRTELDAYKTRCTQLADDLTGLAGDVTRLEGQKAELQTAHDFNLGTLAKTTEELQALLRVNQTLEVDTKALVAESDKLKADLVASNHLVERGRADQQELMSWLRVLAFMMPDDLSPVELVLLLSEVADQIGVKLPDNRFAVNIFARSQAEQFRQQFDDFTADPIEFVARFEVGLIEREERRELLASIRKTIRDAATKKKK